MEKKIVVGNSTNPDTVVKAISGLRKMVTYGKLAEVALAELEEKGCFDIPVTWIDGKAVLVRSFPKYEEVAISDVPDLNQLELTVEKEEKARGGARVFPLFLEGTGLLQNADRTLIEAPLRQIVGCLRLNVNTITYFKSKYENVAFAVAKRKKNIEDTVRQVDDCEAIGALSREIPRWIVHSRYEETQKTLSLREELPEWLVKGGHMARMLKDALRMVCVLDVMER